MGFRAAQWFLGLARYELVHCSTHPNTLRYCHRHSITRLLFISPLICLLFNTWYEPLQLLFGNGKDPPTSSTLHYSATTSSPVFSSTLFEISALSSSCTSGLSLAVLLPASVSVLRFFQLSLLAWPLPQISSLISGSRPAGLGLQSTTFVLQHQGSALPIPSHYHTTQSKLASRFLGLAQWVWVCVSLPSPKHRWTCRGTLPNTFGLRGGRGVGWGWWV